MGKVTFADSVQPNFGIPWRPVLTREQVKDWDAERLARYLKIRKQAEAAAIDNPVGQGWSLPMWDLVQKNWQKYKNIVILGGNRSTKSTLASRLSLWAGATIPEADIRLYHVNEDRSIQDQQAMIYEALPGSIKNIPTKKGMNHSLQFSQKNGFTDNICILPPLPGYRKGSQLIFGNYRQYQQDAQVIEGFKSHVIWCIAEGELVQMADGRLIPIEQVKKGEMILSIDGNGHPVARRVTNTHYMGEKECIRVRPRNGAPVVCTPEHDIYWGYKFKSKKQAKDADRIAQIRLGWWPKNTKDRDDAWYVWAGLFVSEGCFKHKKITSGSESEIEKAIRLLPPHASVRKFEFKKEHNHVPDWFLKWPEFWDEMKDGLSAEKEIPEWVFTSSKKKAILFLRWLYQGDGWASGKAIGYATTSYRLANQIIVLLNRLGVRASFAVRRSARLNWKEQYWVRIHKAEDVLAFAEIVGIEGKEEAVLSVKKTAEQRLVSTKNRGRHFITHGKREQYWSNRARDVRLKSSPITTKTDVGIKRVYDLTVEREHRFMCGTSLVSNCDEECPQKMFETLQYRTIDYHGRIILTFTTLTGWTPLIQDILGKTRTIEKRFAPLVGKELPIMQESLSRPGTVIYYFWTEDNAFIDTSDFVDKIKGRPKDEILARAYGIPTKSITSVFPGFNKEINVIPHEKLPWLEANLKKDKKGNPIPYKVTRYMAIDPAGSKNWFLTWVAVDASGTWFIYREWPDYDDWALPGSTAEGKPGPAQKGSKKGIKDYVELIRGMEGEEEIFERYIDPRMGAAEKQSEEGATTIISDLDDQNMTVIPAPGVDIENGLQLINSLLSYDENKPIDSMNAPRLYVSDRCQNIIHALAEYTGQGGRNEATKDPIDTLRYLAVSDVQFIDQAKITDLQAFGRTGSY